MASSSLPFPVFKVSGDEKSDIEVYVEDLIDYCKMNNWYDASKDTDEQKWTNKDKAMACLRACLTSESHSSAQRILQGKYWRCW